MAWNPSQRLAWLGMSVLAWGCADDPPTSGDEGIPATTAASTSSTSGSTGPSGTSAMLDDTGAPGSTATSSPADDDGGPPPIDFDLGIIPDVGEVEELGCQGIDFLFVIDNSGSMSAQQTQLLASFPGFIDAIETSLDNVDSYHVGVITSDAYSGNAPGCQSIGDLVTQTAGSQSSNSVCTPFSSGLRFATDEDDLQTAFPCIAQVGTTGSFIEEPVTATVAALDPVKAQPGACNEGFIREDAILVVVIVTDDPPFDFDMDDAHPGTDTSGWYDAVVAAKGGEVESIVMIGFVPTPDDLSCTFQDSPNLVGFIEQFGEQGVLASVCEDDYGPVFASTIETIETTCDNFVPQG
ncbi:MAG: vWA domain-containing protein [Nannocystaceae bacterium]|nr:VWA domain-containing protein [bacterium]